MDFEHSERSKKLLKELLNFMDDYVYLAEDIYKSQLQKDRWQVPPIMEELKEKARKKILEIQNELKNGTNIEELAKKYSHDESTAKNGGDLGFFYADRVEKAFVDAVAKLEVGEVTDVVETSYGFHLVELIDTDPGGYAPFEDMKEIIREEMFKEKVRDHVSDYIASLRKKAKIEVLY